MDSLCDTVLMIEPVNFGFNEQTALSNSFQKKGSFDASKIQELALKEFHDFKNLLQEKGIKVIEFQDTPSPSKPDSIFPNNWFLTSKSGDLFTFPMATENRRVEHREDILAYLKEKYFYIIDNSLLEFEKQGKFLEGTGSLVIDHKNSLAFAALSERTNPELVDVYCRKSGNKTLCFEAFGPKGEAIYHTNVMLCLADDFAIIGLETIAKKDRKIVETKLKELGKELILLTNEQVYTHFAGNMLQLKNEKGEKFLIMSERAKRCLTDKQLLQIEKHQNQIIAPNLETIESIGGGSARCMLAEIFHT